MLIRTDGLTGLTSIAAATVEVTRTIAFAIEVATALATVAVTTATLGAIALATITVTTAALSAIALAAVPSPRPPSRDFLAPFFRRRAGPHHDHPRCDFLHRG